MAVKPIPEGYHSLTPYLIVAGATQLIDFLKSAFGAIEEHRMATPEGTIRHAGLRIGDSPLMLAEASDRWPAMPAAIYVYVPDTDAAYAAALEAGATSILAPADQFYGDRNAGVVDPSGNQWWIATHVEDVAPAEMARRQAESASAYQAA